MTSNTKSRKKAVRAKCISLKRERNGIISRFMSILSIYRTFLRDKKSIAEIGLHKECTRLALMLIKLLISSQKRIQGTLNKFFLIQVHWIFFSSDNVFFQLYRSRAWYVSWKINLRFNLTRSWERTQEPIRKLVSEIEQYKKDISTRQFKTSIA